MHHALPPSKCRRTPLERRYLHSACHCSLGGVVFREGTQMSRSKALLVRPLVRWMMGGRTRRAVSLYIAQSAHFLPSLGDLRQMLALGRRLHRKLNRVLASTHEEVLDNVRAVGHTGPAGGTKMQVTLNKPPKYAEFSLFSSLRTVPGSNTASSF